MRKVYAALVLSAAVLATAGVLPALHAQAPLSATASVKTALPATEMEKKGLEYLVSSQTKEGAWVPQFGPAITSMALRAMIRGGMGLDQPAVKKGLEYLETKRQPDGGYYDPESGRPTYNSALVLNLFASIPGDAYKDRIAKLQDFLKGIQSGGALATKDDKGLEVNKDHPWYGGFGYAGKGAKRPDLSNTHFVLEALHNSGIKADDPVMQNALVFVSRCQASSETNNLPWAKGQDNGGLIYSTRWNDQLKLYGESFAGTTKDRDGNEILVAYGSMTYAGLKSFIYAGLTKDDPRVKAAVRWIAGNYTLDTNPGMPAQTAADGLYYYYHTFGKGLAVYGEDVLVDAKGIQRDWRKDLAEKMKANQRPDGSWINLPKSEKELSRWAEGEASYVTSLAVLSLQDARGQ